MRKTTQELWQQIEERYYELILTGYCRDFILMTICKETGFKKNSITNRIRHRKMKRRIRKL